MGDGWLVGWHETVRRSRPNGSAVVATHETGSTSLVLPMATTAIVLNGATIKLVPQERPVFMSIAGSIVRGMYDAPNLSTVVSSIIADGLEKKVDDKNPIFQAALWLMYSLGVRALRVDTEAKRMDVDEQITAEERARDTSDPYTMGNIATGRAALVALSNLRARAFTLNGETHQLRVQPREAMEPFVKQVVASRGVNEDIYSAAMRALGRLVIEQVPTEDSKMACAMLLLSDLGVTGVRITSQDGQAAYGLDGLNEHHAMASAFLQGANTEQVHQARDRVRSLHSALIKRAQEAANAQQAPGAGPAVPQQMSAAIRRRRR